MLRWIKTGRQYRCFLALDANHSYWPHGSHADILMDLFALTSQTHEVSTHHAAHPFDPAGSLCLFQFGVGYQPQGQAWAGPFSNTNLSSPPGQQACTSCHSTDQFFTDPDKSEPISAGVIEGRFGTRNSPPLMYTSASPKFHFDKAEGLFIGGQFDDGRAPTIRDQVKQPFLQPHEMNNQNAEMWVQASSTSITPVI